MSSSAPGSSSSLTTKDIQEDWKSREFVEIININIMKTVQFLNEFDSSVREKLGRLNEKLNRIEGCAQGQLIRLTAVCYYLQAARHR